MYSASQLQDIKINLCYHQNLQKFKFPCPLSQTETTFNSFIFRLADSHPIFLSSPPFCIHIPLLPSLDPLKVQLHPPCPIIKTILPCRSSSLPPPWDAQPAFHRKVISLPWIQSINSIYLACSFHCSGTNGKVLKVYISHFSQKETEEFVPPHCHCFFYFFSGYGSVIVHIILKEWQLTDQ